ncbi:MAG TPA: Mut7-C RNAse domain-containing protein [Candidatus Binataceae bacterium]|nr:Mut7-C RNAse domain-containing protein [Candidatus Binataceae bacterium]HVB80858.1 Mut7-C RNAse domain-containing protein [Candidatus Binataceae bacterium]
MDELSKSDPTSAPRFAADRMLARLARWLRLLGADVLFDPSLGGGELLGRARLEGRVTLTRDKRLRTAADALYLEDNRFRDQLRAVLARFPFDPRRGAFTRCSHCNEPLAEAGRDTVVRRVPPFVYASQQRFVRCPRCGRIYWGATHPERIRRELDAMGL